MILIATVGSMSSSAEEWVVRIDAVKEIISWG